ncbi:MAG: hypothetical protein RLT05_33545 [Bauldia litoralis]
MSENTASEPGLGDRPRGWGQDQLTQFLEMAFHNRLATFDNIPEVRRVIAIDAVYMDVFVGKPWVNPGASIAPTFFIRGHAAWRSAVEHAMSGQVAEVFAPGRLALEYAAYALRICTQEELAEVFLKRHDSEAALKACKSAFRAEKLVRAIGELDVPGADRFEKLYQRAVDYGAHPNERAITGSLSIDDAADPKALTLEQKQLHGEGPQLDHAIRTVCQIGMTCLDIFVLIFPDRFRDVGVMARLPNLRRGL